MTLKWLWTLKDQKIKDTSIKLWFIDIRVNLRNYHIWAYRFSKLPYLAWNLASNQSSRGCTYSLFLPRRVEIELIFALRAVISEIRADFQNCHIWAWNLASGPPTLFYKRDYYNLNTRCCTRCKFSVQCGICFFVILALRGAVDHGTSCGIVRPMEQWMGKGGGITTSITQHAWKHTRTVRAAIYQPSTLPKRYRTGILYYISLCLSAIKHFFWAHDGFESPSKSHFN